MTRQQTIGGGLALALILLLAALATGSPLLMAATAVSLLICVAAPGVFKPWAVFWFGLSRVIGKVVSWVALTLIYSLVVFPVALVRRLAGRDPLMRGQWKKGTGSVFVDRSHTFGPEDIEHPY
ncbi:MAG: SxtJ family membrane protein [Thermodesulfobacteriota bacterium]